jgi:hypothetical protein
LFLPSLAQPRRAERLLAFRGKDSTCGAAVFLSDHDGTSRPPQASNSHRGAAGLAGRAARNLPKSYRFAMTLRPGTKSEIEK